MDYFYYSYTPFFKSVNQVVQEVNIAFVMLTGYSKHEIIGKTINEINHMLKIDSQVDLENFENEFHGYLFTKKYEPREVIITINCYKNKIEKDYFIEEKLNSKIEEVSPYTSSLLRDNVSAAAIFNYSDCMLIKANREYLDFLNIPHSDYGECIGKNLYNIKVGFNGDDLKNIFFKVKKTGKSYYANEFKLEYENRNQKYYFLITVPIYIKGQPKYIISQAYDITENIENREIVENKNIELHAIIENMSDALVVVDKNNNISLSNNSANELLKVSKTSVDAIEEAGLTVDKDDYNMLNLGNFMRSNFLDNDSVNKVILTNKKSDDTQYYTASKNSIYDKFGEVEKSIFCFHDITDRIKNEENLFIKAQYELANKIIDNLELGLQRFSYPEYLIIDLNNKAYRELKDHYPDIEPLSSIRGKNIHDVLNVEDISQEIIRKTIKNNPYIEQINYEANGEKKYLKLIHQPLYGFNNQITEIITVTMDVTDYVKEKKKMEEALKLQDELFVNVSHELKTPLNVIYSAIQLIEIYLQMGDSENYKGKINKSINSIKQNCYRFTKLINNILDSSKIESGHFNMRVSNEDIVYVVENIVLSVAEYVESKELTIIFDTDVEGKIIACDPEKIERVVLNLISNAIKFTNAGGKILVNIHEKKDTIEITVKDTGIGISKDHINNIFKRYHQADKSLSRNAEGSGIGLSLVKSIVVLHGGQISVKSEVGKGSVFKIELPNRLVEDFGNDNLDNRYVNKLEMINIEFSDIYDKGWI